MLVGEWTISRKVESSGVEGGCASDRQRGCVVGVKDVSMGVGRIVAFFYLLDIVMMRFGCVLAVTTNHNVIVIIDYFIF
jgi:hypothetical protein